MIQRRRGLVSAAVAGWILAAVPTVVMLINRGGRAVGEVPLAYLLPLVVALAIAAVAGLAVVKRDEQRRQPRWRDAERSRLERARREAAAVASISELEPDRSVCFRGRVESLDAEPLVASHDAFDDRRGRRFLIRDDSGAALFDDDCFELWTADDLPGEVGLRDGSWVEVIGRGRWVPGPRGTGAGYRQTPEVFALDGHPDAPLHLRPITPPMRVELEEEPAEADLKQPRSAARGG